MKALFGIAAVSAALAGCSVIDGHQRIAGWPELKIIEHHVAHTEMRDRCQRAVSAFSSPEGCTYFYLDRREAHIYVSKDFPTPWVLAHERLHAAGYDHVGSTNMQRMLADWRARARDRDYRLQAAAEGFTY